MFKSAFAASALVLAAAVPAHAATTVTLDFEGATGYFNSIANFYNGGTDSLGHSGPNVGVSFSDAAVGLSNDSDFTYYSHAPSMDTVLVAYDPSATMNVALGFTGQLQFYYSSDVLTLDAVNIYSGLNGTGTLLASASLFGNATLACNDAPYCRFDPSSVKFAGVAKSVVFSGNAGAVAYDNITITAVPEPSAYQLLALGLLAVAVIKRRELR